MTWRSGEYNGANQITLDNIYCLLPPYWLNNSGDLCPKLISFKKLVISETFFLFIWALYKCKPEESAASQHSHLLRFFLHAPNLCLTEGSLKTYFVFTPNTIFHIVSNLSDDLDQASHLKFIEFVLPLFRLVGDLLVMTEASCYVRHTPPCHLQIQQTYPCDNRHRLLAAQAKYQVWIITAVSRAVDYRFFKLGSNRPGDQLCL